MKPHEIILQENKEFIMGVALYDVSPQHDNVILKSILKAYDVIDNTLEALHGCATCSKPYESSFKVILAYCESVNWFSLPDFLKSAKKGDKILTDKDEEAIISKIFKDGQIEVSIPLSGNIIKLIPKAHAKH